MRYPNITAWSYSRYETWALCPRKAYYRYVARFPEGPPSPALANGLAAHEICAEIYNGRWPDPARGPVTKEWRQVLSMHKTYYGSDLEAELQVAFDKDWNRTEWYSKQTVFRCAFDGFAYTPALSHKLKIYEHKTGRKWPGHEEQAELYAVVGATLVPAEVVEVDIHYLDLPVNSPSAVRRMMFTRTQLEQATEKWVAQSAQMLADDEFPTRAGPHCRWCNYRKSNDGPCEMG